MLYKNILICPKCLLNQALEEFASFLQKYGSFYSKFNTINKEIDVWILTGVSFCLFVKQIAFIYNINIFQASNHEHTWFVGDEKDC